MSLIAALSNSSRVLFKAVLGSPPRLALVTGGRLHRLACLLALFSRSDELSETLLAENFSRFQIQGDLTDYESRALDRLRDLMTLRSLAFGRTARGKNRLRQGFVIRTTREISLSDAETDVFGFAFVTQDITESAIIVADLYWKLYDTCLGSIPEIQSVARALYFHLFGVPFKSEVARQRIMHLSDSIQRDLGIPFLILNLLRQGAISEARCVGRHLLTDGVDLADEDLPTVLYWFAEVLWFGQAWGVEKLTHETALRFLYHLCFTNPDRAGFLEIDSPFFAEFEGVNEMAREAFMYRETLLERFLELWAQHEGEFDPLFHKVLEAVAGGGSKISDQRSSWEKQWKRSQEGFSRDYLYVVEGNLCYANGLYRDAVECYETALAITPGLRSALLNLVFAYAKQGRTAEQDLLVERIVSKKGFLPSSLYVAGDSYLLSGNPKKAEHYFSQLKEHPGWNQKVDYYRSTFCFQNGMNQAALEYALRAHAANPTDNTMAYHLSLCYNAMGEKDKALKTLKEHGPVSQMGWLHFYRFTLERDLGNHEDASKTLMKIPSDYFEDPEELEAALNYARGRQDIGLMRHLKKKNSFR